MSNTRSIKAVIGANFGDEGKGLMTDYFCSKVDKNNKVLNIVFNDRKGIGNTVVRGNIEHTFKHFGSGSFNSNVETYLADKFIINPIEFNKEMKRLKELGINAKVYVSRNCAVALPCDIMLNQFLNQHKSRKNGTCKEVIEVNETIVRNTKYKKETIGSIVNDLENFKSTLIDINNNYTEYRIEQLGLVLSDVEMEIITNKCVLTSYIAHFEDMLNHITIVDNSILNNYNNIVFEGSQGLLLNYGKDGKIGDSSTGLKSIMYILKDLDNYDLEVCYVTRPYFIRRGSEIFKDSCSKRDIGKSDIESENDFKYGYFDIEEVRKAIKDDITNSDKIKAEIGLSVTHLNNTNNKIILGSNNRIALAKLEKLLGIKVNYVSYTKEAKDIKIYNERG